MSRTFKSSFLFSVFISLFLLAGCGKEDETVAEETPPAAPAPSVTTAQERQTQPEDRSEAGSSPAVRAIPQEVATTPVTVPESTAEAIAEPPASDSEASETTASTDQTEELLVIRQEPTEESPEPEPPLELAAPEPVSVMRLVDEATTTVSEVLADGGYRTLARLETSECVDSDEDVYLTCVSEMVANAGYRAHFAFNSSVHSNWAELHTFFTLK